MTNRSHHSGAGVNDIPGEDDSTTTGELPEPTVERHDVSPIGTLIKDPSLVNPIIDQAQTIEQRECVMKTSDSHNPATTYIRVNICFGHQVADFITPSVPLDGSTQASLVGGRANKYVAEYARKEPEPPVTAEAIHELRMDKLMSNLRFRHDINFDSELHYGSNLIGSLGPRKKAQNDRYWGKLSSDLVEYTSDPQGYHRSHGRGWTLPCLLKTIKDIVVTLVAPEIVPLVEDALEIDLLMQELAHNVADLERWASLVARFLSNSCAPIRDAMVANMLETLIDGNKCHSIEILCKGLRTLLIVVESMALDVINHQIRRAKEQMICETVRYERHYVEQVVQTGEFDIPSAYHWYKYYHDTDIPVAFPDQCFQTVTAAHDFTWFQYEEYATGFYKGIIHNLAYPLRGRELPRIFAADYERIGGLRACVLDAVNFEICVKIFERYTKRCGWSEQTFAENATDLRSRLRYIVEDHGENLDVLIRLDEMSTRRQQSLGMQRRITKHKWHVATPAVAVEVLRACMLPLNMLTAIEAELAESLSNEESTPFLVCQADIIYRLGMLVETAIGAWERHSSLELHEAAAKPPMDDNHRWSHKIDPSKGPRMLLMNIARITTHMMIHHWRIWLPVAYTPYSGYITPSQMEESHLLPSLHRRPRSPPMSAHDVESSSALDLNPTGYQLAGNRGNLNGASEKRRLDPDQEAPKDSLPEGPKPKTIDPNCASEDRAGGEGETSNADDQPPADE